MRAQATTVFNKLLAARLAAAKAIAALQTRNKPYADMR
jgi:hypothetical protein